MGPFLSPTSVLSSRRVQSRQGPGTNTSLAIALRPATVSLMTTVW
jgi:hypothetical protein